MLMMDFQMQQPETEMLLVASNGIFVRSYSNIITVQEKFVLSASPRLCVCAFQTAKQGKREYTQNNM